MRNRSLFWIWTGVLALLATGACSRQEPRLATDENTRAQAANKEQNDRQDNGRHGSASAHNGDGGAPAGAAQGMGVSFAEDVQPIFSRSCALSGCHGDVQSPNLSRGASYAAIINVPAEEAPLMARLEPGEPDRSYLMLKILGAPTIVGARMPRGGPPLPEEEIELIRRWIEQGAKAN